MQRRKAAPGRPIYELNTATIFRMLAIPTDWDVVGGTWIDFAPPDHLLRRAPTLQVGGSDDVVRIRRPGIVGGGEVRPHALERHADIDGNALGTEIVEFAEDAFKLH